MIRSSVTATSAEKMYDVIGGTHVERASGVEHRHSDAAVAKAMEKENTQEQAARSGRITAEVS